MAARPFHSLLHWLRSASRQRKSGGFTLTELLIGMVIAGFVTSGLLYMVVQLLETNQKESAQTETQADMQRALNYIASELREAVYVYSGDCIEGKGAVTDPNYCPGVVNHIINIPAQTVPILAFWKLDDLPKPVLDDCNSATPKLVGVPCRARRTYSLVVYSLTKNQASDSPKWSGKARITRYELSQYTSDGTLTTNYVTPNRPGVTFVSWPYQRSSTGLENLQTGGKPTSGTFTVLVDFVDDTTGKGGADSKVTSCPVDYELTPKNPIPAPFTGVRSFYACVRAGNAGTTGTNQDIFVFLRGNASGKAGFSKDSFLPSLQTQVLRRGIVNKEPAPL